MLLDLYSCKNDNGGFEMRSIAAIIVAVALTMISCADNDVIVDHGYDYEPAAPTGLNSITGDGEVYLYWYIVDEPDIEFYHIYRSESGAYGGFHRLATVDYNDDDYIDRNVTNGHTYYYRISAVDYSGQESELSDYVMDTPRPEGHNEVIYDYHESSYYNRSGFDLYAGAYVPYDDVDCDIYLDYDADAGGYFVAVRHDDYYIQDFGYAADFDDVGYSPEYGWSGFRYAEAIEGHVYLLKLNHFNEWHYAKIRINDLRSGPRSMQFSWAYQTDPGNRELKINPTAVKHQPAPADNTAAGGETAIK